jgi:3-methylcrotonyl-CoA carboxylase beta subunit
MTLSRSSRQALLIGRQFGRQSSRSQISSQKRAVANLTPPHHAGAISRIQTSVDPSSEEFKENERGHEPHAGTRPQDPEGRI